MKKDINSRKDAVTKDMTPGEMPERDFRFPALGKVVRATSLTEAYKKLKTTKK